MTTEPNDGGYVALNASGETDTVRVYRRHDGWADANDLGERHWFSRTDTNEPARTWTHLTDLGAIAYVGEFVNRA